MLRDAALKALKPKEKIYKVADRDGMYVRVMPSGAISFRLDYRLNGRRETVYLGGYGRDESRSLGPGKSASTHGALSARDDRRRYSRRTFCAKFLSDRSYCSTCWVL
jgi:Arm DNA-binding domain